MVSVSEQRERDLVRELARQVIEFANEPRMQVVRKRWRDVNALRKPDRAPVYCRPVGCWSEIMPQDSLTCEIPEYKALEYGFRQTLHKREIGDDTPVESCFSVRAAFDATPANYWGIDISHHGTTVKGGAWAYDPPLKTRDDFDRLTTPAFSYNAGATQERFERMSELFADIAPVRIEGSPAYGATLGSSAADLRGLEQMMVDMLDEPDLMHRLMSCLRDAALAALDAVEDADIVTPNNVGAMNASDPIGEPNADGSYGFDNCWCMANSQEFDAVSPAMWEEFCLDYQRPIFERHGLVGYGCCENLTTKIDGVLSIPNLRIFVCSAWTDLSAVLEKTGSDYCIMWRQKASAVVYADVPRVRQDLEEGARQLQGRPYQIVLRELQTLAGNLDRLHVWTQAAIDAAERYN